MHIADSACPPPEMATYPLIDTHTHFDDAIFAADRYAQAQLAWQRGVRHLLLVGYVREHLARLSRVQSDLAAFAADGVSVPRAHVALGLHPFYIEMHTDAHLADLRAQLKSTRPLALGEIGLDTYTNAMKTPEMLAKQKRFFIAQLDMATEHQLPVLLHIRKAHAETLAILKKHAYNAQDLGGIAHSFSGGEQEAKAFVKLGFKLGVTGQVTNPNAKKLRRAIVAAVQAYGTECLVIETDCPDMLPVMCQPPFDETQPAAAMMTRNTPANLAWVLAVLAELLDCRPADLAQQLWHNSCHALQRTWAYPDVMQQHP
ncbi:TatD family hydrolase [Psychrobacter aestuarii]|uniref:TatD family hydrolase n=1 Tax=Psychrobacter aestuarii TaxID=556327 RepID=A0ABN0VLL0_9GAMM|nr:TatD family hydrolase [Psychrobacter aestuarii]